MVGPATRGELRAEVERFWTTENPLGLAASRASARDSDSTRLVADGRVGKCFDSQHRAGYFAQNFNDCIDLNAFGTEPANALPRLTDNSRGILLREPYK